MKRSSFDKIAEIAVEEMAYYGSISEKIKDLFIEGLYEYADKCYEYSVCLDCHMAINELDAEERSEKAVADLISDFPLHYYIDKDDFSRQECDCCNSRLGGERHIYMFFKSFKEAN